MALPNQITADELAAFLRSNDRSHDELKFRMSWYEGVESWSDLDIRAVSDAAQRNTSIRGLVVDVAELSNKAAAVIARVISQLRRVRFIWVMDTLRRRADVPMARPHVVDALLCGIMESKSALEKFQLYGCCSPRTILDFIRRYPNLKVLHIDGQHSSVTGDCDSAFNEFAAALVAKMGKLSSLRVLGLHSDAGSTVFLRLLCAAQKSSTIETIFFSVADSSILLLTDAFLFCACECPKNIKKVVVRSKSGHEFLDISSLFPAGVHEAFAPTIKEVEFWRCEASNVDLLWLKRASTALERVEHLSLLKCRFSLALDVLDRLPRLRSFSCISRDKAVQTTNTLDDEFDGTPYALGTNDALTRFCQLIERPSSLLETVVLDVVSVDDSTHFPAIESLLSHSRGTLIVNFGQLPPNSSFHVVRGATRLSIHLHELRIRFCRCQFRDDDFAAFIRALGATTSLKVLEFGFDAHASLGTPESSIAAIRDLVQHNHSLEELSIRGLGSEAASDVVERILPTIATANRSLRTLGFFGAGLAEIWPRLRAPILAALQKNGVLSDLGGDLQVQDDDHEVRHLLRQNRFGRRLLLSRDGGARVPKGLWAAVLGRIAEGQHHEILYAFLRARIVSLLSPSADPPADAGRRSRGEAGGADNNSARRGRRKRARSAT